MWSGNLVPGPGFAFIINWGHSLIGGRDYFEVRHRDTAKLCLILGADAKPLFAGKLSWSGSSPCLLR